MVEILDESGQLVIRIGGQEYARYQYGAPRWKPYLYPVRAANGLSIVADAPTDHRHHHGIWIGHARVGDVDVWLERHNSGRIEHRKFDSVSSGDIGSFTERCDWLAASGNVVLTDTRTFTFYDTPIEARRFDLDLTLRCGGSEPVSLYPTNEAGMPHIRVSDGLSVKTGGTVLNAEGKKNERETYRQKSAWVDCSGKLGRIECGIAIFDHPDNPAHPTPWFTRDYGPISPNFGFFQEEPIVIAPRKPLRLRYGFFTHSGSAESANVAAAWADYLESAQKPEAAPREAQRS